MKYTQRNAESLVTEDSPRNPAQKSACWRHPLWPTFFLLLLAFNLVVIGFDLCPRIERKIARIRIGTIPATDYLRRVQSAATERLSKHKPVKFSDEQRLRIIDYFFPEPYKEKWTYAILATGLCDAYALAPNPDLLKSLVAYGDTLVDHEGHFLLPFHGIEPASQGRVLIFLAKQTKDPKYLKACDEIAGHYLALYQKTGKTLPYEYPDANSNNHFILVDTIGLLCPFLMDYYSATGRREIMEMAMAHLDEYFQYGIEPRSGLPYHGIDPSTGYVPVGYLRWGRGAGWLALGLAGTLPRLQPNSPEQARIAGYARQFVANLIKVQMKEGGWGSILEREGSGFDSGATAMITGFLLTCRNHGIIQPGINDSISRGLEALRLKTRRDGTVDFCEGPVVAGNRHSRLWEPTSFAQGALLSALVENKLYEVSNKPLPVHP